jgi:hypothetical protein
MSDKVSVDTDPIAQQADLTREVRCAHNELAKWSGKPLRCVQCGAPELDCLKDLVTVLTCERDLLRKRLEDADELREEIRELLEEGAEELIEERARCVLAEIHGESPKPITGSEFVDAIHQAIPDAFSELDDVLPESCTCSHSRKFVWTNPNCPQHGEKETGK